MRIEEASCSSDKIIWETGQDRTADAARTRSLFLQDWSVSSLHMAPTFAAASREDSEKSPSPVAAVFNKKRKNKVFICVDISTCFASPSSAPPRRLNKSKPGTNQSITIKALLSKGREGTGRGGPSRRLSFSSHPPPVSSPSILLPPPELASTASLSLLLHSDRVRE
jgi:hypothetical protein